MSTVALDWESRPIARNTSCIAGAWPSISVVAPVAVATADLRGRLGHRAADEGYRMIDVERLRQVFERPALEGRDGAVEVRVRGHDDHGEPRKALLDLVEEREPRLARHPDVRDDHAGVAGGECLLDIVGRDERLVRNAVAFERFLEDPANRAIVVDDPYGFHHGVPDGLKCGGRTRSPLMARRPLRRLEREQHGEHRASRHALALDRAGMLRDERLREREPEAAAAFAPRDERIEDAVANRLGYAGSVVLDDERQREAAAHARERHVARDARREADSRVDRRAPRGPVPHCGRC